VNSANNSFHSRDSPATISTKGINIMQFTGTSIIGQHRASDSMNRFQANNPATGEKLQPEFHSATTEDIQQAVQLASEAMPIYAQLPGRQRADFLRRIAGRLEKAIEVIVERARLETALPVPRLQSELARTCFQLRLFADSAEEGSWVDARIDHGDPQRKPLPKPDLRSMMRPIGPVVVFGAGNFPLAFSVAGGDTASALAAGNPVLVKAHPAHPGTSVLVGLAIQQAALEAGMPEGVFSLLLDAGIEIGTALVKHPRIKAVGFTGSRLGGRALMDLAAARPEPIPVYAEMGSINPIFLLPGGLQQRGEEIAAGLHASVTLGVGQFCTNPGLIVFESSGASESFLGKLASLMAGTTPAPMLTAGISQRYRQGVARLAWTSGVSELARIDAAESSCDGGAALFRVAAWQFLADSNLMEEVFGPATLAVECGNQDEMLVVAQALEGQLTVSVHGTEAELAANRQLISILETKAGRLLYNAFPTGVEVCHSMVHGGPYPATSDGRSTSVGTRAISRFSRPVSYQNFPEAWLPEGLQESNPLGLWRLVDGKPGKH
jgi:NADP-dependent aldehyde dehydrogenase